MFLYTIPFFKEVTFQMFSLLENNVFSELEQLVKKMDKASKMHDQHL